MQEISDYNFLENYETVKKEDIKIKFWFIRLS